MRVSRLDGDTGIEVVEWLMHAVDRTLAIGERASELMRSYCRSASPRAYELWYVYVTGLKPQLNGAVKRVVAERQILSGDDVEAIYDAHLSNERLEAGTDKAGSGLLMEMEQVMGLIEAALGSTAQYGASLAALSGDLSGAVERNALRDIVEALIGATRDVATSNKALEHRLRESHSEIESLRNILDEVRLESLIDPLTGIANRKHFEATLTGAVATALREGSALTLTVIDIDEFKRFNDSYGHLTGDQVLRLVGAAMRENVEGISTLARFGGEEFAIILPRSEPSVARVCAEKIRRNVMGRELLKRSTGESLGRVTVSLGIAALRPDDTATSLLERADLCMYRAKRNGRNQIVTDQEHDIDAIPTAA